ncbi:MAG: hypothetical protein R3F62_12920 [Planctomycetota bacterium]
MHRRPWPLALAALALCGCDSDELRIELIPKSDGAPVVASMPAQDPHGAAPGGAEVHWSLPEGWSESPPQPGGMRFATLHAPAGDGPLDVAVFRFPGEAGGLLANVNRWRDQLGLPAVSEAELPTILTQVEPGVLAIDWAPAAAGGQGLLGAIVSLPQETWFLKAPGTADQLDAVRAGFQTLVGSLHLASGDHSHGAPTPPTAPAEPQLPRWTVPARWTVEAAQPPRLASFRVDAADVAVTRFPGQVGTALANLNRWRQQVGLEPLAEAPPPIAREVGGAPGTWLDLRGPQERMLVVAVPHAGQTWFFKVRGPVADVDAAEPEFAEYLDSVEWSVQAPAPVAAPTPPTPMQTTPIAPPPPTSSGLVWDALPEGWAQAAEPGRMRLATIRAGEAELAVTRFPGDVGGLLQNVNRWRRQIGLAPVLRIEDQPLSELVVDGLAATRVDLDGPEQSLRVVLIPRDGQTWFVKLVGPPAAVAAETERFAHFAQTLRFEEVR